MSGVKTKPCSADHINTSFAPIQLDLPEDAGYQVTARTTLAKSTPTLPVSISGAIATKTLPATW